MDKKKFMKEWLKWAMENETNRKEAVNGALKMISALNNLPKDSQISDADLDRVTGGVAKSTESRTPFSEVVGDCF